MTLRIADLPPLLKDGPLLKGGPLPKNGLPKNGPLVRDPRSRAGSHDGAAIAIALAATAFGVPLEELRARTRKQAHVAFARQVAMYLVHTVGGFSLTDVARAFGRDRTTASHACHVVEDRRDDPHFDRRLLALEGALKSSLALQQV